MKPKNITDMMLEKDNFSNWMNLDIIHISTGSCAVKMKVREEMLNGFGVVHGGITYSLADSAFAFASNSYNNIAVSLETSMSYPAPVHKGDLLTAYAQEISLTNKIGVYDVKVKKDDGSIVGIFRGTVYRTGKPHIEEKI